MTRSRNLESINTGTEDKMNSTLPNSVSESLHLCILNLLMDLPTSQESQTSSSNEHNLCLLSRPSTPMQSWRPNDTQENPSSSWSVEPFQDVESSQEFSPFCMSPEQQGYSPPHSADFPWESLMAGDGDDLEPNAEASGEHFTFGEDQGSIFTDGSNLFLDTSSVDGGVFDTGSLPNQYPAGSASKVDMLEDHSTQAMIEIDHPAKNSQPSIFDLTSKPSSKTAEEQFMAKRECDGCHQPMDGPKLQQNRKGGRFQLRVVPRWCHSTESCWSNCVDQIVKEPSIQAELSPLPGMTPSSFGPKGFSYDPQPQSSQNISDSSWRYATQKKTRLIASHIFCPCARCEKIICWKMQSSSKSSVKRPRRDIDMCCGYICSSKGTHEEGNTGLW